MNSDLSSLLKKGPILLYDGECGVCARAVQWILSHEYTHKLRFASLQSSCGKQLTQAAHLSPSLDSLVWLEENQGQLKAQIYADAVIATLLYVKGYRVALFLIRLVPRLLRNLSYRCFARYRHHFTPATCLLAPQEMRHRFLGECSVEIKKHPLS